MILDNDSLGLSSFVPIGVKSGYVRTHDLSTKNESIATTIEARKIIRAKKSPGDACFLGISTINQVQALISDLSCLCSGWWAVAGPVLFCSLFAGQGVGSGEHMSPVEGPVLRNTQHLPPATQR